MNKIWIHGLLSAFIGGAANALYSGITLLLAAPNEFNLGAALKKTLLTILVLALLSGIQTAAAYLKQAPTPWDGANERRAQPETAKSAGAGS